MESYIHSIYRSHGLASAASINKEQAQLNLLLIKTASVTL